MEKYLIQQNKVRIQKLLKEIDMATISLPTAAEKNDLFKTLKNQENSILYMYLDTKGNVTIGVGFMLASAHAARVFSAQVPFYKSNGSKATASEVEAEYRNIKKQKYGIHIGAGAFKKDATLTVKQSDVDSYLKKQINQKWKRAAEEFGVADFNKLPEEAKLVLFDIQYNTLHGVNGYKHLVEAMKRRDWKKAKANATRPDAPSRETYCKNLIQKIIDRDAKKKNAPHPAQPTRNTPSLQPAY
jgi:GH24 family phage-related lysozyme (muramidase)